LGKEQFERKIRRVVTQAGAITWDGKPIAVGAQSPDAADELASITSEARTGSVTAFSALFERFQSPLVNYIYRLVGDWDAANDLAQDTFLKAYNALPRTEESLQISPWLYRIATNTALDSLRRRKRITWVPFSPEMEPAAPMSDYALRHADQDSIQRALHAVPADQRTCLVLNMYQGLSYKEIAETLGISVNLVAVRIFRGREKFIEAYKKANPAD
jgi:RNA polymerase sigma-70 factor, ECF subfamily